MITTQVTRQGLFKPFFEIDYLSFLKKFQVFGHIFHVFGHIFQVLDTSFQVLGKFFQVSVVTFYF